MPKFLCVYCASSSHLDAKYHCAAVALGRGLVERGWSLVYGGGNVGLMGAVAQAVKDRGGTVVGVIPEFMRARELAFTAADELIVVDSMRERKRLMAERADAFVALPGGIGTLEELAETMTERYLNLSRKPVVIVNQAGFYDDLLRFFARMVAERFKSDGLGRLYAVADEVAGVWPLLENPVPYEPDRIWAPTTR